ncbi:organic cation/carnitine transporter 2-like [Oppia nitens]|uniref:organic cation/carnitine transporter 2-like n=1 Tax=Oppia nitens TaxID=1686743 RepID=UPI0023DC2628|nr:organic cation/carnitine transporter 2-like [Oppia nitens]
MDTRYAEYEDIIEEVGGFGRYQKCLVALLIPVSIVSAFHHNIIHFKLMPDHWCAVPELANFSHGEQHRLIRPVVIQATNSGINGHQQRAVRDTCLMFDIDYQQVLNELRLPPVNQTKCHKKLSVKPCNRGWLYDRSQYWDSFVMKFDIVCENSHKFNVIPFIRTVGSICGTPLFGLIADLWTPESLQWLIIKNKYNLVETTFKQIMQINNQLIDEDLLSMQVQKIGKPVTSDEPVDEEEILQAIILKESPLKRIHKLVIKFLKETTLFQTLFILSLSFVINFMSQHIFNKHRYVFAKQDILLNDIIWSSLRLLPILVTWFLIQRRTGRRLTNSLIISLIGVTVLSLWPTNTSEIRFWISLFGHWPLLFHWPD